MAKGLLEVCQPKGDWRIAYCAINSESPPDDSYGMERLPFWEVRADRYVDGKPCNLDFAIFTINPFREQLLNYYCNVNGVRLPQTAPLISEEAARTIAIQAFHALMPSERLLSFEEMEPAPSYRQAAWVPIPGANWSAPASEPVPCRLAYMYFFELKKLLHWEYAHEAAAIIDAETGEVWSMGIVTGGMIPTKTLVSRSPVSRFVLAGQLYNDPKTRSFTQALLASKPLQDKLLSPPKGASRWFVAAKEVGSKPVTLALDRKHHRILWTRDNAYWEGANVPAKLFDPVWRRWQDVQLK